MTTTTDEGQQLTEEQQKEQAVLERKEASEGFSAGFDKVQKPGADEDPKPAADRSTAEASAAEAEAKAQADAEAAKAAEAKAKADADAQARTEAKFLEALPSRLRTIEGHLGGLNSKLDTALATAKAAADKKGVDAPSDTQVQAALSNPTAWKQLKEDFPDWAGPVEAEFAAIRGEIAKAKSSTVDVEGIKKEVAGSVGEAISAGLDEAEERALVRLKHPTWRSTVKTPDFKAWYATQPDDVKALSKSKVADDAVKLLDGYAGHQKTVSASAEARLKQEKRLASALTPKGTSGDAAVGIDDEEAFARGFKRGKGK